MLMFQVNFEQKQLVYIQKPHNQCELLIYIHTSILPDLNFLYFDYNVQDVISSCQESIACAMDKDMYDDVGEGDCFGQTHAELKFEGNAGL